MMISPAFNLGVNLSGAQKLTPQMQQAIKLLQLSSIELEQEVQMKLDSNPLLERVEDTAVGAEDFNSLEELTRQELSATEQEDYYDAYSEPHDNDYAAQIENGQIASGQIEKGLLPDSLDNSHQKNSDSIDQNKDPIDSSELMSDSSRLELTIDTDWNDVFTHAPTAMSAPNTKDWADYQGATEVSLQDHIRWQLNFAHLSESDTLILDYLIDAMDEDGFIDIDIDELKASFDEMASFYQWHKPIEQAQITNMMHLIQDCEPLGVGATSLAECLQIQLRHLDEDTPYRTQAIRLLDEHELLVNNRIKALEQKIGIQNSEIGECLKLIRTLNPAPGLAFHSAQPVYATLPESYDIPDVLVSLVQEQDSSPVWKVALNPDTLPKLRVNQEYASLIKKGDTSPDNIYLRDNLMDARLFIRSIEERNQNLLKVATCIIKRQQRFLLEGATAMQPMILKDIAEEVDLHESTVSRLTTSKSILTPQGLFSLKHFFSSHVSSDKGDVSSTAISAMIQALIAEEDPAKPLSDSKLQQLLKDRGIDIARRTVAKYREAQNIASSTQRKRKF